MESLKFKVEVNTYQEDIELNSREFNENFISFKNGANYNNFNIDNFSLWGCKFHQLCFIDEKSAFLSIDQDQLQKARLEIFYSYTNEEEEPERESITIKLIDYCN